MSLIAAEGLAVDQGATRVLSGVDFHIDKGEIVTVIGPNGSGKSTLLRALIGALEVAQGSVRRAEGLNIGYVPQRLALDGALPITVRRFLGLPRRHPDQVVQAALTRAGVSDLAGRQMTALSGGQFQRVLLARALIGQPDLLVLDEPTQGLDQPAIVEFYELVADLRRRLGCAVLMVSHELHVVMRASDRVICLNGHICCQGAPAAVSLDPQYRALFGPAAEALALYHHEHDHSHDHHHGHDHGHEHRAHEHDHEGRG